MNAEQFTNEVKEVFLHNENPVTVWNNEMIDAELKIIYDNCFGELFKRVEILEKRIERIK